MKITKEIREYIKDKIMQKEQESTVLAELKQAKEEEEAAWEQELERIKTETNRQLKEAAEKFGFSYERYRYSEGFVPVCRFDYAHPSGLPVNKAYSDKQAEYSRLVEKACRDICVEIQLGGDAEDLRAMIDEVAFD